MVLFRPLTPDEFKFLNEIKNKSILKNGNRRIEQQKNRGNSNLVPQSIWTIPLEGKAKINVEWSMELKAMLGIGNGRGNAESAVKLGELLGMRGMGGSKSMGQMGGGKWRKMVSALVLRMDIYEEESIAVMFSPDLPKSMPLFAIFSIAFKSGQNPEIGRWFQLDIEPQHFSMGRLQEYFRAHKFPFMECRQPPQALHLIDSPIWPVSRIQNGKVQLLIDFKIRSFLPEIAPIWCRAQNFPSIQDTEGKLRKIICTKMGMAGKLEAKLKMSGWCELRRFKFEDSDWKIGSILKVKKIK